MSVRRKITQGIMAGAIALASLGGGMTASAADATPTKVDHGNRIAVLADRSALYYAVDRSGDDATSCTNDPDIYKYGRVSATYAHSVKETGCAAPEAGDMAADATHLYYTYGSFGPNRAYRQPVNGGPAEPLISFATVRDAVAVDATHAFFVVDDASTGGLALVKVHKATLQLTLIVQLPNVAGNKINDLAVDDAYVYWTEGADLNAGAVRAVSKNGGAIFTAAAAGVQMAYDVHIDGDYVYWSEVGGEIRRRLKKNGAIETLHSGDDPVYGIDVQGDTLYFGMGTTNGSIWRKPKSGGAATLMTFDRYAPHALTVLSERLYWAEGSVYYLDKTSSTPGVDYGLTKLEVTQGLQDGANSISLASNKPTYVRAYGRELSGSADKQLSAFLYGFDSNGRPLRGSPIKPLKKVNVDGDGALRSEPEQSFIFLLPAEWTTADYRLQAEINPNDGARAFELNYANNRFPAAPAPFAVNERVTCVVTYPVAAANGEDALVPDFDDVLYADSMDRAESLLPADVWNYPQATTLYSDVENTTPYSLSLQPDRKALMQALADLGDQSEPPAGCASEATAYAGFAHGDIDSYDPIKDFNFGGQGNGDTQAMWSRMWGVTDHQPFNWPRGAVTIAHEVGHVLGRAHVDCNDPDGPDPNYPYADPCLLGDSNDEDAVWGFDGLTLLAIDPMDSSPTGAGDLMSYRKNRWPSPYTWQAIDDELAGLTKNEMNADTLGDGDMLWVRGSIEADSSAAELLPAYRYDAASLTATQRAQAAESLALRGADTAYAIELLDSQGAVIATQPIEADASEDANAAGGDESLLFHTTMPYNPAAAGVRLVARSPQQVLAERTVSAAAPSVQFAGRPTVDRAGNLQVAWGGQDADGDGLRYVLHYRSNDGRRIALAVDTAATSASIPTAHLPGGTSGGTLLLHATDGVNTSAVVEQPVALQAKRPQVQINQPTNGAVLSADAAVVLRGGAWDAEDGILAQQNLIWYVGKEEVGRGRWLSVSDLAPGTYTAQLVATDSANMTAEASITFTIR